MGASNGEAKPPRPLAPPRLVTGPLDIPHRIAMGLEALLPDEPWIEQDADLEADLREKRRLLSELRDRVFVELPASRPAQAEARERVAGALVALDPTRYRRAGDCFELPFLGESHDFAADAPPLEMASRWLQEDLCIMEGEGANWRLTAGSVCFPTRWDLVPRLGMPMTEIHENVPRYEERLSHSADRFFDGMRDGRVFRRANWSLVDDLALYQPGGKGRTAPDPSLDATNAGEKVWLRVEHQTLQRLPETGAILFTIRIHRSPLARVGAVREAATSLLGSLRTMEPAMRRYKSLEVVREAVEGYLEARLA